MGEFPRLQWKHCSETTGLCVKLSVALTPATWHPFIPPRAQWPKKEFSEPYYIINAMRETLNEDIANEKVSS